MENELSTAAQAALQEWEDASTEYPLRPDRVARSTNALFSFNEIRPRHLKEAERRVEIINNTRPKSLTEMEALAKRLFGEDANVYFSNEQWVIETGVEEKVDLSEFEDTPAFEAYNTPEGNYGSVLERWMAKNGYYGSSLAEGMRTFNEVQERHLKESIALVRSFIAEGKEFEWEGGPEYRDQMLKLAEEKGW